jgi:hypothetical protein
VASRIANQIILLRGIGFEKDGRKSKDEELTWTPAKRELARKLHLGNRHTTIAAQMGCQEADLPVILAEESGIMVIFSDSKSKNLDNKKVSQIVQLAKC